MKAGSIGILAAVVLLAGCQRSQEKTRPILEDITESVYASGIIKSNNQYQVFSTVNGLIQQINIQEGDSVKKGDVLIELENTYAQLSTENAAFAADYNTLHANSERLIELKNSISLAKSRMETDAVLQQRQQTLWNANIGTKNELEARQLTYKSSMNAYLTSKLHYTQLEKEISFQGKQSKKNLEIAASAKGDYTIKSEMDGKVYRILLEKGEMATTQAPLAVIGDAAFFTIELQVDEYDIIRVKPRQVVWLSMDSYKGEVFEAVVIKINPIMSEKTKSFTIETTFKHPPNTLYPFLTCEANIVIQEKKKALTIPRGYLLEGDMVLLNKGVKRKVVTGLKDYEKVEILDGILVTDFIYKPRS